MSAHHKYEYEATEVMLACAGQLAGRSRFWTILQIREKSPPRNVELRITRHAHAHTHKYRRREAETVLSGSRRLKTYISLLSDRYTRPPDHKSESVPVTQGASLYQWILRMQKRVAATVYEKSCKLPWG